MSKSFRHPQIDERRPSRRVRKRKAMWSRMETRRLRRKGGGLLPPQEGEA